MKQTSNETLSPIILNLFELGEDADTGKASSEKKRLRSFNKRLSDETLKKYNINVHKFSNIHYRFYGYDYWPTTTKWMAYKKIKGRTVYVKKDSGFGLDILLAKLEIYES